jgi:hypothetical protein
MVFFWDFPTPPEGHPDNRIVRSYIWGGYMLHESSVPSSDSSHGAKH